VVSQTCSRETLHFLSAAADLATPSREPTGARPALPLQLVETMFKSDALLHCADAPDSSSQTVLLGLLDLPLSAILRFLPVADLGRLASVCIRITKRTQPSVVTTALVNLRFCSFIRCAGLPRATRR
jgi:hypothetical protein